MASKFHTGPRRGAGSRRGAGGSPQKHTPGVYLNSGSPVCQRPEAPRATWVVGITGRAYISPTTSAPAYVEHPFLLAVSKPVYWEHRGHGTGFQTPFPAQSRKKKKVGRKEESNRFPVCLLALC